MCTGPNSAAFHELIRYVTDPSCLVFHSTTYTSISYSEQEINSALAAISEQGSMHSIATNAIHSVFLFLFSKDL